MPMRLGSTTIMIEIGTSPTVESRQSTTDQLSQVDELYAIRTVVRVGIRLDGGDPGAQPAQQVGDHHRGRLA